MSPESQPTRRIELLLFVDTLLLYILNVVATDHRDLIWDEGRYHKYAEHLTQGFYVTPEKPDIINGPGYPLVMASIIAAAVPVMGQRMLNTLFMAFAVWFSFRAVLPYAGRHWALIVALITALHPSLVRVGPYLMTEALAVCCIVGFGWAFSAALRAEKWHWSLILAAGFAFGWLTLTRVFFGNVIMATVVFLVLLLIVWKSQRGKLLRALAVMAVSFTICVPWLAFTKAQTGDLLCWSTNSSELLYWATSTHEGENGHWFSEDDSLNKKELIVVTFIAVNGPIILMAFVTFVIGFRSSRHVPIEIALLALMILIYKGGSSLAPCLPLYSVVIWPWLGLCIAAVLSKHLRVSLA